MSKILCECGNVIVDQTDDLEYKAFFIRDQNTKEVARRTSEIAEFINAIKTNNRKQWLQGYFDNNIYDELDDESIINDILLKFEVKYESVMYNCTRCGSIIIQKGKENKFLIYHPSGDNLKSIFKGLK